LAATYAAVALLRSSLRAAPPVFTMQEAPLGLPAEVR
jgi:hypothetical protein